MYLVNEKPGFRLRSVLLLTSCSSLYNMTSPRLYTNEESPIQTNQYLIYNRVSILYMKERILLSGTDQTEHYARSDIILEHFRVDGISFQTQERKERKRD